MDPDAPSRAAPAAREWLHYLCLNVPSSGMLSEGVPIVQYVRSFLSFLPMFILFRTCLSCKQLGSAPPKGSGLHRYVWLVFRQPAGKLAEPFPLNIDALTTAGRPQFRIVDFVQKLFNQQLQQLVCVGVNFYQAEYEPYVDEVYARLH